MEYDDSTTSEKEMHEIELLKNNLGLGITVAGYICDQENINGIFVKEIFCGSAADLTGRIRKHDRIIKVNDRSITSLPNDQAIELLRSSGPVVKITVERYITSVTSVNVQHQIVNEKNSVNQISCNKEHCESLFNKVDILPENKNQGNISSANSVLDDKTISKVFPVEEFKNSRNVNSPFNQKGNISELAQKIQRLHYNQIPSDNYTPTNLINVKMVDLKDEISQNVIKSDVSVNSDSIYYSKTSDDSEKDGYDTCMDESLSEEIYIKASQDLDASEISKENSNNICKTMNHDASRDSNNIEQFEFNKNFTNMEVYSDPNDITDADEFYLVEYINDSVPDSNVNTILSDVDSPYTYDVHTSVTYKCIKLHEYYNDFEDCLEDYKVYIESPSKKASTTLSNCDENYSYDRSFDTLASEYDFLPSNIFLSKCYSDSHIYKHFHVCEDVIRRRSSFEQNYKDILSCDIDMTVTSKQQNLHLKNQGASEKLLRKYWSSIKNIQVARNSAQNLGISIVCGKVDFHTPYAETLEATSGIFIKSIIPNSVAGNIGQFQIGDRILEVNGVALTDIGHEEAASIIRSANNPISFVVQSLVPPFQGDSENPKSNVLQNKRESILNDKPSILRNEIENKNETRQSISPPNDISNKKNDEIVVQQNSTIQQNGSDPVIKQTSNYTQKQESVDEEDEDSDEAEDERELEGRIFTKQGMEIDRSSAGNLKRTAAETAADKEEEDEFGYTTDKIKKKYAKLGNTVMMVKLERGQQGLGLSLAGHKDRNCMAVFVCGLNPNGAAYRTGGIQVGDEILEVNGVVLHGRCHLNASAIIKGLAGPIFKVLILRRKTALEDIAVRPITQFPVNLEEEVWEDKFSHYPNVRHITIKKENHSLGIMIIEGKHAELGQGIFISDIQDGSPADKAGLEVGELILAVNKDSLLGSSYENAATLLKRTEGVVTLILSNPKKTESAEGDGSQTPSGLKTSGPPSRAITPVPEPPADPSTCAITPGKMTTIEINTNNQGLGLYFIGGKDTSTSDGIIIVEVFSGGAAEKDGRLQPGDQIIEANSVSFKDVTNECVMQTLRQTLPKIKIIVFRPDKVEYTNVDVDMVRKPGKGLGLSIISSKCGKRFYVAEILNGGNADIDGRIAKGDLLVSVNDEKSENLNIEQIGAILKSMSGKVVLKFHRYKSTSR